MSIAPVRLFYNPELTIFTLELDEQKVKQI